MQFRDIKQNYPVYILDKQALTVTQGKATSVSFPRQENVITGSVVPGNGRTVVDITVEAAGKTATYSIPDNLSVATANSGDLVISVDADGLTREIEAMRSVAQQVIDSVPRQKEILEKSSALLADLNPAYREKKVMDERFGKMEDRLGSLEKAINSLISELKN